MNRIRPQVINICSSYIEGGDLIFRLIRQLLVYYNNIKEYHHWLQRG